MIHPSTLLGRVLRHPFLASVPGFLFAAAAASAAVVSFDIPAQPAPAALDLFIKQSGAQVVYLLADVKDVKTNPVKGAFEPAVALELALKDTGLGFTERKPGQFSVGRLAPVTGSVKGTLVGDYGSALADVLVSIRETGQSASTDPHGEYVFPQVAAGTYVLVATASGYQPLHITDVVVHRGSDVTLGREKMRRAPEGVLALEPIVVHADTVTELEKFEVTGMKQKPFEGANMDVARTINDVQPYYILDAQTIEESGAANIENLLKQQLTMNATALTNGQMVGAGATYGNTSNINLRGLGTDKTLILVNGRRLAGVTLGVGDYQPDLNGIPLSAIQQIEVLPSSASGIYGGSAIGGVVNIILKRNYSGGEIRASYDNTLNSDAPSRTFSVSYGRGLPGGKTHLQLNAYWSDANALMVQDRRALFDRTMARIQANSPNYFGATTNTTPWLGNLPNILSTSTSSTIPATNLTLDDGTALNSRMTYVPAGTSTGTSAATLGAGLLANAGRWNMDWPDSTQANTGLRRKLGGEPKIRSFSASVRHQLLPRLELFGDFSYNENRSSVLWNPILSSYVTVLATAPSNPFQQPVLVRIPNNVNSPFVTRSMTRSVTLGAMAKLPWEWNGELDYTQSANSYGYRQGIGDGPAINADIASGVLNPFVDTLLNPPDLEKYVGYATNFNSSTLRDVALRAAGPVKALPWGEPQLSTGLEHRVARTDAGTTDTQYAVSTTNNYLTTFYPRKQVTDSAYAETTIPLVKNDWLPLVHALDLQMSGRSERYAVDGGTTSRNYYYGKTVPTVSYLGVTRNGEPYFGRAGYTSNNFTIGGKYQPVEEVTLRFSRASAFLPPTPAQLAPANEPSTTASTVTDPKTGAKVSLYPVSGGNPNLTPQSSKSLNVGLIWEPRWMRLRGLRLDAEYYEIEQSNYISTLSAQQIVDLESLYPDRVIRDASGTITTVNTSNLNLYSRKTTGWDFSASYMFKTASLGNFNIRASESIIQKLLTQYSISLPAYEAAGYHPKEEGAPKYKSTVNLVWERHQWTAAWTTHYVSSYKVMGAAGGPYSLRFASGGVYAASTYSTPQGSDHIPGQIYHDAFISYAFGKPKTTAGAAAKDGKAFSLRSFGAAFLSGLTLQVGVRNVFNAAPPLDVAYDSNYYLSPYGDLRLRSFWLNIKKTF